MAPRFKSVITFLAAVMVVATAACAGEAPVPTPNIDATIEANRVGVEIEKGVKATMAHSLITEHFNQGVTYAKQGEYQLAIEDFDKIIQLDPHHAAVYNNRGIAYDKLGQYQGPSKTTTKLYG